MLSGGDGRTAGGFEGGGRRGRTPQCGGGGADPRGVRQASGALETLSGGIRSAAKKVAAAAGVGGAAPGLSVPQVVRVGELLDQKRTQRARALEAKTAMEHFAAFHDPVAALLPPFAPGGSIHDQVGTAGGARHPLDAPCPRRRAAG